MFFIFIFKSGATPVFPEQLAAMYKDMLPPFFMFWPIPRHVCYSLDSTFCKQLKKLSVLNDIHILVYYLQWTYMHSPTCIVSIGKDIFQTPPLISPHYHILLCHVCYIRRFLFFGTIQECVKFCEVLGLSYYNAASLSSVRGFRPQISSEIRFPRKPLARFGSNSTIVLTRNQRCALSFVFVRVYSTFTIKWLLGRVSFASYYRLLRPRPPTVGPSVALSADHTGAPNLWKNTMKN